LLNAKCCERSPSPSGSTSVQIRFVNGRGEKKRGVGKS
jgi:hypothetical protein